jgi:ABC-type Fe3+-hydroxamate transport system substrate-binding protein
LSPRISHIAISLALLWSIFSSSCQESKNTLGPANPEWLSNSYAKGFQLGTQDRDSFLLIFDPSTGDTLGQFQWGPKSYLGFTHLNSRLRIASGSGVISGLLSALHHQDKLVAVDQRSYQPHLVQVREDLVQFSLGGNFNREILIQSEPDLLLHYFFESGSRQEIERLQPHIPVIWIQNYREAHPLAKSEWLRAIGFLLGDYPKADSLFSDISQRYQQLAKRSLKPHPIFCNLPYSGTWAFPGGKSYLGTLIHDAGGLPIWPQSEGSESVIVGIEEAARFLEDHPGALWIHPGDCPDWDCVVERAPRIMKQSAWQPHRMAQCDKGDFAGQVNRWYNEGSVRPDRLLSDLQHLTQDSVIQAEDLYFYRCLEPQP